MDSEIRELYKYCDEIEALILTLQLMKNIFLLVPNPAVPLYYLHPTTQLLRQIKSPLKCIIHIHQCDKM